MPRTRFQVCPSTKPTPVTNSAVTRNLELIRIAIVGSPPEFRDGLWNLLTSEQDFRLVAREGDDREVLELIEEHQPDILLLDLDVPGSDGLTALRKLWKSRTNTKVIVLAASKHKNQFVQAMKLGAHGIVLKQTRPELLIKSIRKVHAGEIWLDSDTMVAVMRRFSSRREPTPLSRDENCCPLSQREREIVALVAQGFRNKDMATKMSISEQTVKNHLHNIFEKLAVSDRLELALYAVHQGIHTPRIASGYSPLRRKALGALHRNESRLRVCPGTSTFAQELRQAVVDRLESRPGHAVQIS